MIFAVVAIAALLFLSFFLIFGYLCFRRTCKRNLGRDPYSRGYINTTKYKPYEQQMVAALKKYESFERQEVYVTSADGLRLAADYIPAGKPSGKLVIAFHGYRSCAAADVSPVCESLLEAGVSLLLPYQRSHGKSEGKYITFGAFERFDCKLWCDYAVENFGETVEIYLYGVSMGAATVLMSAELELCKNVKGIIADCGFNSPLAIIKNTLSHRYRIPVYPVIYFMNFWSRILARFDFGGVSCAKAMKKNELPILFIHGGEDTYVPTYMSYENALACGENGRILIFDGATHARSYLSDPERYFKELSDFLEI